MGMILAKNVSKIYETGSKKTYALSDVSFEIDKGEFVVILGQSGAGKSTLLNILGGIDSLSTGEVIVNDSPLSKMKENELAEYRAKEIGFIFQFYNLIPTLTVYENVAFAMYIVKATPRHIRRQVPMVLSLVGLSGKAKMYPNELSGGEQQRVALARALVNNPSMIIADEPTGNLDPETAWEIMNLLKDINARGTTIVVATHAKDIVDRMNKRVIRIENGNIIRDEKGGYDSEI